MIILARGCSNSLFGKLDEFGVLLIEPIFGIGYDKFRPLLLVPSFVDNV